MYIGEVAVGRELILPDDRAGDPAEGRGEKGDLLTGAGHALATERPLAIRVGTAADERRMPARSKWAATDLRGEHNQIT